MIPSIRALMGLTRWNVSDADSCGLRLGLRQSIFSDSTAAIQLSDLQDVVPTENRPKSSSLPPNTVTYYANDEPLSVVIIITRLKQH